MSERPLDQRFYTIDIPNDAGSNEFSAIYGTRWIYSGGITCAVTSNFAWEFFFANNPTHPYYITTNPNTHITEYNSSGGVVFDGEINGVFQSSHGVIYYYESHRTTSHGGVPYPIDPSQLYASGCTLTQAFDLVINGSKTLRYSDATGDPYANYGDGGLGGDIIPVPTLPTLSAANTGICTLFVPTAAEMRTLADYLWTDSSQQSPSSVLDALIEIAQALWRTLADPLKVMLGLTIIPSRGLPVSSGRYAIQAGMFLVPSCFMHVLENQYYEVDCGTLSFSAVCGDTFLDYAPYSKFQIYLPFVGIVNVDANDFVGHTIGVKYHIDALSGSCTAYITKDSSVFYTYSGNVALNIPLSSDSWATTIQTAVQLVAAGVTPTPSATTPPADPLYGEGIREISEYAPNWKPSSESGSSNASIAALNPSILSPSVSRSGSVASAAGFMNIMKPFVIREAVRFQSTEGMNELHGYPLHATRTIGSMIGYTVIKDVHLEGIPATASEISEIESLLSGGVVL